MTKTIIGLMGPGSSPTKKDLDCAHKIGSHIAKEGWVLLTGGRKAGVMEAASRGASQEGGLTIGVLPGSDKSDMSEFVDIPIVTGMGSARNNINVLTSDVVVACGTSKGTTSEIMLALKAGKRIILLNQTKKALRFFKELCGDKMQVANSPKQAISKIYAILDM